VATDLLDLELRLLLARHGRDRVIAALARVSDTSPEEIEETLREFERSTSRRRVKPQKTVRAILADLKIPSKKIFDLVSEAAGLLEAKVIFPNRREVIAFLRKHGIDRSGAKSRREALPQVLRILSSLDEPQLREVLETASRSGESDYALLANKILGKTQSGTKRPAEPD
jgi:hypothetical protein